MNCQQCERKLGDFAVHRLDPKVAATVQSHLARCSACREFLARVRSLYELPEPFADVAPPARAPLPLPRARRAAAVGLGIAAAGLLLALLAWRTLPRSGGSVPLALTPVRVTLPEEPPPYRPGAWMTSREEARRVAAYAGLPVLEEYVWPGCPRCKGVNERLVPEEVPVLEGLVLCRQMASEGLPAELEAAHPDAARDSVYPAMRVVEDGCATPTVWSVGDLDMVEDVVAAYYEACVLPKKDGRAALDLELYDWALATLRSVPELVDEGRFGEAFARIDQARRLEASYRTRFVADARALEASLAAGLERRAGELEALADGSAADRRRARDAARALAAQLASSPLRERLERLAR